MNNEKRSIFGEIATSAVVIGGGAFAAYLWLTHEPPPKDPCKELREYFAQVHDADEIRTALGQSAKVKVVETPNAENGLPCGVVLEPIDP